MKKSNPLVHHFPVRTFSAPGAPISMKKLSGMVLSLLMLAGCANYGTPKNVVIPDPREADKYSMHDWQEFTDQFCERQPFDQLCRAQSID